MTSHDYSIKAGETPGDRPSRDHLDHHAERPVGSARHRAVSSGAARRRRRGWGRIYNLELSSFGGGGGGGSGEIFTVRLTKGQKVNVGIGVGGSAGSGSPQFGWAGSDGSSGEKTLFGELQVNGGGGGYVQSSYAGGAASGSLATDGSGGGLNYSGPGGVGNKNNPSQTYGNGGLGGNGAYAGSAGNPGAAIITFLGA